MHKWFRSTSEINEFESLRCSSKLLFLKRDKVIKTKNIRGKSAQLNEVHNLLEGKSEPETHDEPENSSGKSTQMCMCSFTFCECLKSIYARTLN